MMLWDFFKKKNQEDNKIQELEKDIKIKEYTINMLQRKLKECNEKTEDSNKLI